MFDRGNRQYYVAAGGIPLLMKAFQTVAITEHPYEIRICQDCTHTFSSNLCKYTRWQDHSDSISNGNDSMITWNYNVTIFFWFCENYYISTLSLFSHKSSWGKVLFAASLTFTCGLSLHASLYVAPCTSPCTSLWCAPEHRAHCAPAPAPVCGVHQSTLCTSPCTSLWCAPEHRSHYAPVPAPGLWCPPEHRAHCAPVPAPDCGVHQSTQHTEHTVHQSLHQSVVCTRAQSTLCTSPCTSLWCASEHRPHCAPVPAPVCGVHQSTEHTVHQSLHRSVVCTRAQSTLCISVNVHWSLFFSFSFSSSASFFFFFFFKSQWACSRDGHILAHYKPSSSSSSSLSSEKFLTLSQWPPSCMLED